MVCAVSLLMPNSSAINLGVSRWSCTSIGHTFSIITEVLLFDGRPERGSYSVVSFLSQKRLNHSIRKHIFCSRLPSRTPAPTFNASPLQFSPVFFSRTWILHVALLRCDTNFHTDYVQLAAVDLHCQSHEVHAVENHVLARTHASSCRSDMTPFTELFTHIIQHNTDF